jgi:hypothetical protein
MMGAYPFTPVNKSVALESKKLMLFEYGQMLMISKVEFVCEKKWRRALESTHFSGNLTALVVAI